MRRVKGSVTIFLSLTISTFILMLTVLIILVLDRYEKVRFEIISDICLNSVLGEYSKPLYETYDLYYVDPGYSGYLDDGGSIDGIRSRANYYFDQNLSDGTSTKVNNLWGRISLESVSIDDFQTAAAGFGNSMRAQIGRNIDTGKYASFVSEEIISGISDINADLLKSDDSFFEEWHGLMQAISEKELPKKINQETGKIEYVQLTNPSDWVYALSQNDILFNTGIDLSDISSASLPLENCITRRGINHTQIMGEIPEYNNSHIDYFILDKMNSFRNRSKIRLSGYETEYILEGEDSDYLNFRKVVEDITRIRLSDNRNCIENNTGIMARALEEAQVLEVCTLDQSFIEPVAKSIVYACIYLETLNDITGLLNARRVPISKSNIAVKVENILAETKVSTEYVEGLTYIQYLLAMINEMNEQTINLRIMDLIEMEIRRQTGSSFMMDSCVERLYTTICGSGKYSKSININRLYGYY